MDRGDRIGLGVALAGHVLLFGALSLGFLSAPEPPKIERRPIDVSLVKDVALEATAPQAVTPPAPSVAPDRGSPEDAAPPEPAVAEPEPEPEPAPAPQPKPAPPKPAPPKPAPPKPAPPKPTPAPPKPVPVAKPVPAAKPAAVAKAKPKPKPVAVAEAPAPTKPAPEKPATSSPAKTAKAAAKPAKAPAAAKGTGTEVAAKATRPHGSRLGADFLKGLSDTPTRSTSTAPVAAKIDAHALASIQAAIARQIQPCADRQVDPGPGANQIVTVLNLRLNEDGTLSATPRVVRQTGVDDENGRYAKRVIDLGVAAFKGCSPLKLPPEYYSTAAGGWNNINYNWQLR